ncbi:MAG: hypothetical protein INQ03_16925 [Candidatus Heimdallarchaeota archaeon]|nr:hypothetical protein [Candidatus Heimdallarchaeota archaeon]
MRLLLFLVILTTLLVGSAEPGVILEGPQLTTEYGSFLIQEWTYNYQQNGDHELLIQAHVVMNFDPGVSGFFHLHVNTINEENSSIYSYGSGFPNYGSWEVIDDTFVDGFNANETDFYFGILNDGLSKSEYDNVFEFSIYVDEKIDSFDGELTINIVDHSGKIWGPTPVHKFHDVDIIYQDPLYLTTQGRLNFNFALLLLLPVISLVRKK